MTYTVNTVGEMQALAATAGDICNVTSTSSWYKYDGSVWNFWYKELTPIAFQGITFELPDDYIGNEFVFQGITFETEVQPPDLLFFGIV